MDRRRHSFVNNLLPAEDDPPNFQHYGPASAIGRRAQSADDSMAAFMKRKAQEMALERAESLGGPMQGRLGSPAAAPPSGGVPAAPVQPGTASSNPFAFMGAGRSPTLAQMERYFDRNHPYTRPNYSYGWRTYRNSVRDEFRNLPPEVRAAMYSPFWVPSAVYAPVAAQVTWRALPTAPVGASSTQTFLNTTGLRQLNTVDGAAFATGRVFTATGALGSDAMMRAGLISVSAGYTTTTGIIGFGLGYNSPMDQPDPVLFFNPATSAFVTWSFVGGAVREIHVRHGNNNP